MNETGNTYTYRLHLASLKDMTLNSIPLTLRTELRLRLTVQVPDLPPLVYIWDRSEYYFKGFKNRTNIKNKIPGRLVRMCNLNTTRWSNF